MPSFALKALSHAEPADGHMGGASAGVMGARPGPPGLCRDPDRPALLVSGVPRVSSFLCLSPSSPPQSTGPTLRIVTLFLGLEGTDASL